MEFFLNKLYIRYNIILLSFFDKINSMNSINNSSFVFQSEGDYTDNAKALSDYVLENNTKHDIKIFWIVSNKKKFKSSKNEKFLSYRSWNPFNIYKLSKALSSSKYFFFTHPWWFKKKKKEQIVINLWHGTTFKNPTGAIGNTYDYMICPSENVLDWQSKFTGTLKEQMIICGYPRNDYLYSNNSNIEKIIKKENNKLIVCLPTYHQAENRNDSDKINPYIIPYIVNEEQLKKLDNYLINNNIILLIKPHHLQKINFVKNISCKNIVFLQDEDLVKNKIQLYELLSKADALLTDVSSVYFDYLLLDRQIGFYIEEVEAYKNKRGYMIDNYYDYMPGKFIENNQDFIDFIFDVSSNTDNFKKQREKINDFANKYKRDHCKRVLDKLNIRI